MWSGRLQRPSMDDTGGASVYSLMEMTVEISPPDPFVRELASKLRRPFPDHLEAAHGRTGTPGRTCRQWLGSVGAVPERAAVGHGPRGLQCRRHGLGFLQPRRVPQPGVSLGRR